MGTHSQRDMMQMPQWFTLTTLLTLHAGRLQQERLNPLSRVRGGSEERKLKRTNKMYCVFYGNIPKLSNTSWVLSLKSWAVLTSKEFSIYPLSIRYLPIVELVIEIWLWNVRFLAENSSCHQFGSTTAESLSVVTQTLCKNMVWKHR